MRTFLVALAGIALAAAPTAVATECEDYIVIGHEATGYFFIDNDMCQPECLFSVWVYSDDDPDPCDGEANTIVI